MTGRVYVAAAMLMVLASSACSRSSNAASPRAVRSLHVAEVHTGPSVPPLYATGVLAMHDEIRLAFKTGGLIRRITVSDGDAVQKGQILAELDPTETGSNLIQAQQSYAKARRDLSRGQDLYAGDVITREQLEDLKTAESVARASLEASEFNAQQAVIRAPFDGRVLHRLFQAHELVAAGEPVLTLTNDHSRQVLQIQLSDRDYVSVRLGDAAIIGFDAFPDVQYSGTVTEREQAADPHSGAFPAEIALNLNKDNAAVLLPSGLIGHAEIQAGGHSRQLSYVPMAALIGGDQKEASLFLVDNDAKVHERRVSVAFRIGDLAALNQMLPAGTRVVATDAPDLHDGDSIHVVP